MRQIDFVIAVPNTFPFMGYAYTALVDNEPSPHITADKPEAVDFEVVTVAKFLLTQRDAMVNGCPVVEWSLDLIGNSKNRQKTMRTIARGIHPCFMTSGELTDIINKVSTPCEDKLETDLYAEWENLCDILDEGPATSADNENFSSDTRDRQQ